jgi:hypothetical protein
MISVRLAFEEDSETIFAWRNNEITRAMSTLAETDEKMAIERFDLNNESALV